VNLIYTRSKAICILIAFSTLDALHDIQISVYIMNSAITLHVLPIVLRCVLSKRWRQLQVLTISITLIPEKITL